MEREETGVCLAQFPCRIKKVYITDNPYYRGEMCHGCLWWQEDKPAQKKEVIDDKRRQG